MITNFDQDMTILPKVLILLLKNSEKVTYHTHTLSRIYHLLCRADSHIIWASDCDAGLMLVALIECIIVPSIIDVLLQI